MKKYYDILGIHYNANENEIKQAYKELSKKYHPDKYFNNPLADLATEKFREIQDAYQVLISNFENVNFQINNNDIQNSDMYNKIIEEVSSLARIFRRRDNFNISWLIPYPYFDENGKQIFRDQVLNQSLIAARKVIPKLEEAIRLDEDRLEAYEILGLAYSAGAWEFFNKKNIYYEYRKKSRECIKKAIERGSNDVFIILDYGQTLLARADYVSAINLFHRYLNNNKVHQDVVALLAWSYQELGHMKEAKCYWNILRNIKPNHYDLRREKNLSNMFTYMDYCNAYKSFLCEWYSY